MCTNIMLFHSSVKKEEQNYDIPSKRRGLEIVVLNQTSQIQKDKHFSIIAEFKFLK